jgi:hypothetical protein
MSSHREAPEISKDPVADSTDLYAFVSPDNPETVTIIANYVPLESPDGGPNFYEFGTDVLYAINIDNDGDGKADISYLFQFQSETTNLDTFLYNTGPISSLTDPNWNRRQTYTVTRVLAEREDDRARQRAGRARPATWGPCPPRTTRPVWPIRPSRSCPTARRSSPASGPTVSTSTSGPSSTSPSCARWLQITS